MQLPDSRCIYYPFADLVEGKYGTDIEHMKAAWKPKAGATEWPRARLWHGTLAENGTQAICASLLRGALVRGWRQGLPIIGHVHDEVVLESAGRGARAVKAMQHDLERVMVDVPEWATGFPLAVETAASPRFGK
jgi:DNA polymerase